MTTKDVLLDSGKSILQSLHDKNCQEHMDDSEYITIIKTIIKGLSEYAANIELPANQITDLTNSLKKHALTLYLIVWLETGEEGENEEEAIQEGTEYFQYIFEHEMYPE